MYSDRLGSEGRGWPGQLREVPWRPGDGDRLLRAVRPVAAAAALPPPAILPPRLVRLLHAQQGDTPIGGHDQVRTRIMVTLGQPKWENIKNLRLLGKPI